MKSIDETLAAIAAKAIKESRYHLRRSEDWIKRLGDGTEESHRRVQEAFNQLWAYWPEMFDTATSSVGTLESGGVVIHDVLSPSEVPISLAKAKAARFFKDSLGICLIAASGTRTMTENDDPKYNGIVEKVEVAVSSLPALHQQGVCSGRLDLPGQHLLSESQFFAPLAIMMGQDAPDS